MDKSMIRYTKKVYKLIEKYPGLNNKISIGDIFTKENNKGFYKKIASEEDFFFEDYIYITVNPEEYQKYFEEILIHFTI